MLTALIAGSLLAQIEQSPRLKSTLPNNAQIYVERLKTPGKASVALAVSTAGFEFKSAEHGWIHLVEHLVARGKTKDLDRRLEAQGMMLTATTTRDASLFQISGRTEQMPFAIQCLRELAEPITVTEEEIKREINILREEFCVRTDTDLMTEMAWVGVMGPSGGAPFGSLESMAAATPADVAATHQKLFSAGSISVAVAGDLDVTLTAQRLTEVFGNLGKTEPAEAPTREALTEIGSDQAALSSGAVRGVTTEGLDDVRGAAALMAAMGFWVELEGVQPVYTPSTWPGLVFLTSRSRGGLDRLDAMEDGELASFFPQARRLTLTWIDSIITDPVKLAGTMAVLSRQNSSLNSERLREWFLVVKQDQFTAAAIRFKREGAFTVVGGAR